jgi:hypothetical protein
MVMKRTTGSRLAEMTRDLGDRCLTRYWLAIRRSFDQAQWLSLGVDCGRVGKKSCWAGLAATPGNLGVVIPPLETMPPKLEPATFLESIPFGILWDSCLWVVRFFETFQKTQGKTKKILARMFSYFGGIPVRFFFPSPLGDPQGLFRIVVWYRSSMVSHFFALDWVQLIL